MNERSPERRVRPIRSPTNPRGGRRPPRKHAFLKRLPIRYPNREQSYLYDNGCGMKEANLSHEPQHAGKGGPTLGRLSARPQELPRGRPAPGVHRLGLAAGRDGLIYVPRRARDRAPSPLVVALHGAGGSAKGALALLRNLADDGRLILVAPESRGRTWDVLMGGFGPDVAFIDEALDRVFARSTIDRRHLAVGGFSDGASYALSLGLTNGDLFTHVIAFSPGFAAPGAPHGSPEVFVSHGLRDQVLRIDATSRRVVPRLRAMGYAVTYREFDGGHTVPTATAREAVGWLLRGKR